MLAKQFSDIIKQNRHETAEDPLRRFDPPATFTSDKGKEPHSAPVAPDETPGPHSPRRRRWTVNWQLSQRRERPNWLSSWSPTPDTRSSSRRTVL